MTYFGRGCKMGKKVAPFVVDLVEESLNDDWFNSARLKKKAKKGDKVAQELLDLKENTKMIEMETD